MIELYINGSSGRMGTTINDLVNTNDEFKDFIVIDNSVKPAGIVYESESEEKCKKWIKK